MINMGPFLEGPVKYRDGKTKKWKKRWCVLHRQSSTLNSVFLYLLKDEEKWTTDIDHQDEILGLESGRNTEKVPFVIFLVGWHRVHCIALPSDNEMFHWAEKLGDVLIDTHYHATVSKSGDTSRLPVKLQCTLHIQQGRICLIKEPDVGNKFICAWPLETIKSHWIEMPDQFCIETTKAATKYRGTHHFEVDPNYLNNIEEDMKRIIDLSDNPLTQIANKAIPRPTYTRHSFDTPPSSTSWDHPDRLPPIFGSLPNSDINIAQYFAKDNYTNRDQKDGVHRSSEMKIPRSRQNSSPDSQRQRASTLGVPSESLPLGLHGRPTIDSLHDSIDHDDMFFADEDIHENAMDSKSKNSLDDPEEEDIEYNCQRSETLEIEADVQRRCYVNINEVMSQSLSRQYGQASRPNPPLASFSISSHSSSSPHSPPSSTNLVNTTPPVTSSRPCTCSTHSMVSPKSNKTTTSPSVASLFKNRFFTRNNSQNIVPVQPSKHKRKRSASLHITGSLKNGELDSSSLGCSPLRNSPSALQSSLSKTFVAPQCSTCYPISVATGSSPSIAIRQTMSANGESASLGSYGHMTEPRKNHASRWGGLPICDRRLSLASSGSKLPRSPSRSEDMLPAGGPSPVDDVFPPTWEQDPFLEPIKEGAAVDHNTQSRVPPFNRSLSASLLRDLPGSLAKSAPPTTNRNGSVCNTPSESLIERSQGITRPRIQSASAQSSVACGSVNGRSGCSVQGDSAYHSGSVISGNLNGASLSNSPPNESMSSSSTTCKQRATTEYFDRRSNFTGPASISEDSGPLKVHLPMSSGSYGESGSNRSLVHRNSNQQRSSDYVNLNLSPSSNSASEALNSKGPIPKEVMDPSFNYAMVDLRPSPSVAGAASNSPASPAPPSTLHISLPYIPLSYVPPVEHANLNYVRVIAGQSQDASHHTSCSAPTNGVIPPLLNSSQQRVLLDMTGYSTQQEDSSVNYAQIDFEKTEAINALNLASTSNHLMESDLETTGSGEKIWKYFNKVGRAIGNSSRKKSESTGSS